ncbi:hypothetical protein P691DRAFT_757405 [Macrolepiota fuliginosa MF-IS2]|uniref:Uncharacterized protein n=1 Tax=Macrolepiota fuliginosa MF-IS2 TaxID=1400762 RepID=A0A9P6C7J7_9AGAR|nr:hypothetical protein P691DRAFT_757405 [Macrolepiota fuliginosa MF-IS2]
MKFLAAAGLKGEEWERHRACLEALICLHSLEAADNLEAMDSMKLMMTTKRFPNHTADELMNCRMVRYDTFLAALCTYEFQKAFKLYTNHLGQRLGLRIATNVLQAKYSFMEWSFRDPRTGKWGTESHLPFKVWVGTLPFCSKAPLAKRCKAVDWATRGF